MSGPKIKEPRVTSPTSSDMTEWLATQMSDIATSEAVSQLQHFKGGWGLTDNAGANMAWASLVRKGAIWDFKPDILKSEVTFNDGDRENMIIIGKHTLRHDFAASASYGYIGRVAGFSELFLSAGAGLAQLGDQGLDDFNFEDLAYFGDKPTDGWAVRFGYYLFDLYGDDPSQITADLLAQALDDYMANNPIPERQD